jgi:hypothetical protein
MRNGWAAMSAAYEMFLERQEAEDEAAGKPLGVKVDALPPKRRETCENCPRPSDGAFYCPRCAATRRKRRSLERAARLGAAGTGDR